jgi:KipI family sensor histidine kinase inhibitor
MYDNPKFLGSGDSCLVVEFSDQIEMEANIRLQNLRRGIESMRVRGIRELVPTYRSISIHHDPLKISRAGVEEIITRALAASTASPDGPRRVLVMPVAYGGEYGPDMENVSRHTGLSEYEIVRRHTSREYYCYMLGFTPGFGYFGGLDETLETPRLKTPRTLIPAGSVGIAGKQTGAYSIEGPGGWQLIGRTPLKLFDPLDELNPTLIDAGDWIRLRAITSGEYKEIKISVDAGSYLPERFFEESPCLS